MSDSVSSFVLVVTCSVPIDVLVRQRARIYASRTGIGSSGTTGAGGGSGAFAGVPGLSEESRTPAEGWKPGAHQRRAGSTWRASCGRLCLVIDGNQHSEIGRVRPHASCHGRGQSAESSRCRLMPTLFAPGQSTKAARVGSGNSFASGPWPGKCFSSSRPTLRIPATEP